MPDATLPEGLPRSERLAKKVLLIGWDAADWKVIHPLLDAGKMPALEALIDRGVMGNIATMDPPLSPMLWTSIATGKTADEHGVLGFVQPTEDGSALRPILGTSRQVKAFWNILNQCGLRTNVISWWPSHPADPISQGAVVSNFYQKASKPITDPWPLPDGTVHPPELAEPLAACRLHPGELTANHLAPFISDFAEAIKIEAEDKRIGSLAASIAHATSVHAATTYLMENREWDVTAVYLDAIDHLGHGFMKFHPPHRTGIPEDLYERYKGVIEAGYRFHDMMLEQLVALAGEDATVILVSDHGFHSDHLRPMGLSKAPAAPAEEHRDFGVFVMAGPHVRPDEWIYGASLLDVTPTLLTLLGLPVGQDMRGRPLVEAFEEVPEVAYVPSWEDVDGDDGQHDASTRSDPWAEREAMQQLIELGYIEAPEGDVAEQIAKLEREAQFYLARVYLSTGRPAQAAPLLEQLWDKDPEAYRFGQRLVDAYLALGRPQDALTVTEQLAEPYAEARESGKPSPGLDLMEGTVRLAAGQIEEALVLLRRAEQADPHRPALPLRLGRAYLQAERWDEAERAYRKALAIDPESPAAHHGLAMAYLKQGQFEEAAGEALRAVGLRYSFPSAHYHLGEALMRMGEHARAAEAFEVAVQQSPGMRKAHFWLSELYRLRLDQPARAAEHLRFIEEQIKPAAPNPL